MNVFGLGTPPLEPRPSQYNDPLPSMTPPGAIVMVTFLPPKLMGLKSLELVNSKEVVPAKVTTEFFFSLARLMVLFVGATIP